MIISEEMYEVELHAIYTFKNCVFMMEMVTKLLVLLLQFCSPSEIQSHP